MKKLIYIDDAGFTTVNGIRITDLCSSFILSEKQRYTLSDVLWKMVLRLKDYESCDIEPYDIEKIQYHIERMGELARGEK